MNSWNNTHELQLALPAPDASIHHCKVSFLRQQQQGQCKAGDASRSKAARVDRNRTGTAWAMLHVRRQRQTSRVSNDARKVEMKTGAHSS